MNPSEAATRLISLYEELSEFKNDPEFHDVGFAICCRFNRWMKDVDELTEQTGIELISEVGFLPGDLRQLGMEYMGSRGQPTSYSEWMETTIAAGQSPQ